ncbi:DNA polymerase III subunit beta [Candidatus Kaiserbacteria bacterium]|nr:DNA polymerase III subunit beta [Candidatus Kaiserbacteria bacterium]
MNITVQHEALQNLLEHAARISTKHLTLPALECVLLIAENNTLSIKATNLEIGIEGSLPTQETEAGSVSVSAQTLLQTISLSTQKEITLKTEENVLVVETPTSKTEINTTDVEEFPHIPQIEGKGQKVHGKNFALGIKNSAFAASQSSIKPELGSVYVFQKKEQALTFVATDSFRLVEKTVPQPGLTLDDSILIPHKNALELARVCEVHEEDPQFLVNENQCALAFENLYITSRLTAGTFPDYAQIIPKEYATHTTLLTADLVNALKKTSIFLNKFMQLTLEVSGGELRLTSKGEIGVTKEKINAATEGDDITLNVNQRYIQDILGYVVDDSVVIHFAGIGRPLVLESVHDRSLRYLVMPMNK